MPYINVSEDSNFDSQEPMIIRKSGDLGKQKTYLSKEVGTLCANPKSDQIPLVVSDFQKSTNIHQNFCAKDSQESKTMETQDKLIQKNYQILICCVEDFLAKHSQSLEKGEVFKIPEEHSFLRLQVH